MADRIKNYQQEADQITTLKAIRTDLGVTPSSYTPDATVVTKDRVVTFAQAEEELVVLSDIEKGVKQQVTEVDIAQKDIANIKALLQGHLYDYQTDTDSAYTKSVPAGAMPYAGLEKIGGKTLVWNQLVKFPSSITKEGITWTKNADNSYTANGTADSVGASFDVSAVIYNVPLTHKILIKGCPSGGSRNTYFYRDGFNSTNDDIGNGSIYTNRYNSSVLARLVVAGGVTVTNLVWKPLMFDLTLMYGAGNEPSTVEEFESMFPASYYPYNAGTLLSAGVTEVVSKGKNLLDPTQVVQGTIGNDGVNLDGYDIAKTRLRTPFIQVIEGETYTISCKAGSTASDRILVYEVDFYNATTGWTQHFYQTTDAFSDDITIPNGIHYIKVLFKKANNAVITPDELQDPLIAKKSTYFDISYPIPTAIRNLEGYGWSVETAYNYVDFDRKVFVQAVKSINLGEKTYEKITDGWFRFTQSDLDGHLFNANDITNTIVCSNLVVSSLGAVYNDTVDHAVCVANGNDPANPLRQLQFRYNGITSASDFKTAMSGIMLYYKLQTPVETDISQYLTDDNLIQVEAGGTLTFENQHGDDYRLPVPSTEEYMIDLQEALS